MNDLYGNGGAGGPTSDGEVSPARATGDEAGFYIGSTNQPEGVRFFDPTLALRMSKQAGSERRPQASPEPEGGGGG